MGLDIHNPVFITAALLILVFVVATIIAPGPMGGVMGGLREFFENNFDFAFLMAGNLFVLFCLALIFMPVGKIRLGGEDAKPDFSTPSWLAMLFAAGMGIGLMFWAVAEPVGYFTEWFGTPLNAEAGDARAAMGATMYHWGLHPWAIYGVVALALAFFTYNKGLPLTIRSTFYPLLGERVWGPIGHVIDILAVLATLFGLATSLGFGAQQAAGGIAYLTNDAIAADLGTQIGIIIGVTFLALISVMRGIDGGVKILSNINVAMAGALMLFVILVGGLATFFSYLFTTTTSYVEYILPLSNPFGREDETFYYGWTVFYWAWWISWSPFVGMFIARVSKGRTVREFLTAVLIVPTAVTIVWMSALGGNGLHQAAEGIGILGTDGITNADLSLFHMLDNLPLANITAFIAIILVLVFFVTSSDSGSLVIDSITAGGKIDAPQAQRVFWVVVEGMIAAALLFGGGGDGLTALQNASIATGFPFAVILILMCVSIVKGLMHENKLLAAEKAVKAGN
ncbi:MAG: BCCT family transporter [Natronospirillum sp.]|uniref:BCCT family transporter n=1 Tax=Natronospirillum sp. TaxID=2812955 RepID=UPI0025F221BF|nr:BCCT family transporter [Natronospirillum sp.]MCH8550399.1 BCCT family transporter [Natronospirillum sp.]